ncbi:MAG: 16S rRNA (guanine(966)-N(2))-methyltransferase RsmD [Candidatus Eremiobacterota bacterium]
MGNLRILGGTEKGREIKSCKGLHVRPMLGRIKKSLFDIIQNRVRGSICLDLFSGTASIGLEAISRGAAHVTFIEKNREAISIIKHNIKLLEFEKQSTLIESDVFNVLKTLEGTFDIIFLDPPFPELHVEEVMKILSEKELIKDNGVLVIHHPVYKDYSENIGILNCTRKIKYGQNFLSFYTSYTSYTRIHE